MPGEPKFKNTLLYEALVKMANYVGLTKLPIVEGKVVFDEEAQKKLKAFLPEGQLEAAIEAANKDLGEENEIDKIKSELHGVLATLEIPQEELEDVVKGAQEKNQGDSLSLVKAISEGVKSYQAKQKLIIDKLSNTAEDDLPIDQLIDKNKKNMKHSATHLWASGKEYDSIDSSRPWNIAASKGLDTSATDYTNEVVIQKLNGDADLYFRENPTEIKSLHRDNFQLPDFWPKRLKVDHLVSDGSVVTGEITQGRKFGWLPKNVQEIQAEVGQIFPIQIDAEWSGFDLQKIETSWLNMMNKEGSQPEKMTFVRFLVGEIMKKARQEDRIATLNGIFVQTPKSATKAGKFLNRQNGLFYLLWKARDYDKKYRAFSMPTITPENVMDWFHSESTDSLGFVNRLPQEVLAATNGVIYMHYKVWEWYRAKYKQINGTNMDYKGLPDHLDNKPQIRVQTFIDQESKDFVFFTFDDNIQILENIPEEKSSYKFQIQVRNILLLGDYKLGIRIIHIGNEVREGSPDAFNVQSVWSNDAPIFNSDKFIPIFDDTLGIVRPAFNNVAVDSSWATDITKIENVKPGQIIKIRGNASMAASKKIKHDASKIKLASNTDFDLQSGGTLTLRINASLVAVEISRTSSAPSAPSGTIKFTDDNLNASLGTDYKYDGVSALTLASVDGGVNNKTIKIYGKTGAALTVEDVAGNISVGADVVLNTDAKYVELVNVDGVWYKGETNV